MEGGMNQPMSTIFFIKQRTNGIKESFARANSPDKPSTGLIWSRKAEILNWDFKWGFVKPTASI